MQFVDISGFQPDIDWRAYRQWSNVVAMKSSEGIGFADPTFSAHRAGAIAAGVDIVLYYHFARPDLGNSPEFEADYQHSVVGAIRDTDLMILDYEVNDARATADWAARWLTQQHQNYRGKLPGIYAATAYIHERLQDTRLAMYPLWLAQWTFDVAMRPQCPPPWRNYTALQYTDRAANVPGVPGTVDANIYLGDERMTEVCSVVDVSQFAEIGHSVDKCGFYAISLLKYAGKPGQSPTGTAAQVASWADTEYVAYDGPDAFSNNNGMTVGMEYSVINDAGLHYQGIGTTETGFHTERLTADYVRAWLKPGYPVIIAVAEDTVYDLDLGAKPYAWNTTGLFHIIVATGIAADNNLLCHDTASIDSNGVRRGPRRYDAERLQAGMISATAVVMPWLQRPQPDFDPMTGGNMGIPQGWSDDGATLLPPDKSHKVVHGFRDTILHAATWDAGNVPREDEQGVAQVELHAATGPGTRQIFRDTMMIWTAKNGVHTSAAGDEIKACYDRIAAQALQIAALQSQLKAAQPSTIDIQSAVAALTVLTTANAGISGATDALKKALGVQ